MKTAAPEAHILHEAVVLQQHDCAAMLPAVKVRLQGRLQDSKSECQRERRCMACMDRDMDSVVQHMVTIMQWQLLLVSKDSPG